MLPDSSVLGMPSSAISVAGGHVVLAMDQNASKKVQHIGTIWRTPKSCTLCVPLLPVHGMEVHGYAGEATPVICPA